MTGDMGYYVEWAGWSKNVCSFIPQNYFLDNTLIAKYWRQYDKEVKKTNIESGLKINELEKDNK